MERFQPLKTEYTSNLLARDLTPRSAWATRAPT